MKSVLISIQPKWCELIANGKKTVEVRKTKPKLETPFKVYIYCTLQGSNEFFKGLKNSLGEYEALSKWNRENWGIKKGKVIGEFVCDEIKEIRADNLVAIYFNNPCENTCLNDLEMREYANGKNLFLWHISNLVIYDKPRAASEFHKPCEDIKNCFNNNFRAVGRCLDKCFDCGCGITKPPQSWCYVESEVTE